MKKRVHIDNKKKYVVIIDDDPTQGLDGTTLAVEKNYLINFIVRKKKIRFKLTIMEPIAIYL